MRAHFLVYRLISCKSAFDMQPDGVFDELACFFLGLPLGIAALEGGTNGHKPAILVPLNHNSEFVILHSSTASEDIVPLLPYFYSCPCTRSEEHTSELQSPCNLVCRL